MDAPDTVTDAIRSLHDLGYTAEFDLVDGHLRHDGLSVACRVEDAVVERLFRFEGPSDPGDEMVVFGVRDPASGQRGVLTSAFGSSADPEILAHLVGLSSRYRLGDPVPTDAAQP
jgi:hypothetical protein